MLVNRDSNILTMTLRDGAPTTGALSALSMTTAGTYFTESVDVGAFIEAVAFLRLTGITGTNPTLDVKFQGSSDQKNWVDLADAFTQVTAATNVTAIKRLTANFGKYIRAVMIIGGTSSPTYVVTFQLAVKG